MKRNGSLLMNKIMLQINTGLVPLAIMLLSIFVIPPARAESANTDNERAQIVQAFQQQHIATEKAKSISLKDKYRIMFILGVTLLFLVLTTGGLGVAMVVYGKQVFVIHMIFAGLTMTLAVIHAIVGMVWFFPY